MAAPWDDIVVGSRKLPQCVFDDFFYTEFDKPNEELFGTCRGWHRHDGEFKTGTYLKYIQSYETNLPNSSGQRNGEEQHYTDIYGDNPDPFALYTRRDGHLVMSSHETRPEEEPWARVKGYWRMQDGREAQADWFTAENGFPDGVPHEWQGEFDGHAMFFANRPSKYVSSMISTAGRKAMSFGRFAARLSAPTGCRFGPNWRSDRRDIHTVFPAFWCLQDIIANHDLNGRYLATTRADTPGNQGAEGRHPEIDMGEWFGYSKSEIQSTLHFYLNGAKKDDRVQQLSSHAPPVRFPDNRAMLEIGVDVTPGKVMFWIGDTVRSIVPTPYSIATPLMHYISRAEAGQGSETYLPALNPDGTVMHDGTQTHADGSDVYMRYFSLFNIAYSQTFALGIAQSLKEQGSTDLPDYDPVNEMEIEWFGMFPLAVENPDQHRTVDYGKGETGGSYGRGGEPPGGGCVVWNPGSGGYIGDGRTEAPAFGLVPPNVAGFHFVFYGGTAGALRWSPAASGASYEIRQDGELIGTPPRSNTNFEIRDLPESADPTWEIVTVQGCTRSSGVTADRSGVVGSPFEFTEKIGDHDKHEEKCPECGSKDVAYVITPVSVRTRKKS